MANFKPIYDEFGNDISYAVIVNGRIICKAVSLEVFHNTCSNVETDFSIYGITNYLCKNDIVGGYYTAVYQTPDLISEAAANSWKQNYEAAATAAADN